MPFCSRLSLALRATLRSGALLFIAVVIFAGAVSAQSMRGFQAPEKPLTPEQMLPDSIKAARGLAPLNRLYGHLMVDATKARHLPRLDPCEQKKSVSEKLLRIGVVRPLPIPLNPLTDSEFYSVSEGDVRVSSVVSEGALQTRVHFTDMSLPKGARVFVYSASDPNDFTGPYEGRGASGDGTFWTPPLKGDTVVIEYVTVPGSKAGSTPFRVLEVSHTFKELTGEDAAGFCNLEVTPQWSTVAKATGMLDFISGGSAFVCTGTLLNDTASDQIPYVLTANHCIDSQVEAQSVIVYWNYLTGDDPPGGTQTTFGATLLATGNASDFTLIRLTGALPGGLFFSGWDATPISTGTSVTGIHHPGGSHKRISFGTTNSAVGGGLPGPAANFTGVTWSSGTTEEGSSGSGIWTGAPDGVNDVNDVRLVGTLTGGLASCANPSDPDFYGRFSVTYPNIAPFLSSCVTSINPTGQTFTNAGGSGSITVNTPGGCSWSAISTEPSFVTITGGSSGVSSGTVTFNVAANNGWARSAAIIVGSQVFVINQARSGSAACTPTAINIGQTVNGTLATSDCAFGDGTVLDPYSFTALAGQQVAISMSSGTFDTFLYLLNPDGSTLLSNDDIAPGNLNSRIPPSGFITLPTSGTYTILANAFDDSTNGGVGAYTLQITAPAPTMQLSQSTYTVNESSAFATITVTRFGDTTGPATVKYATSDATDVNFICNPSTGGQITGAASRKCDYHIAAGRLRFAPGENSKQIILSIVNDVYVEPTEGLTLTLSSPTGVGLGTTTTASISITDNDTPGQANPIDGTGFFVRMLYVDLLSREPDPAGFAGWVHRIDFCGQPGEPPPPCDRVTVGGDGFLRSAEFFDREFFVIRLYRTALGRILRYDDVGDLAFVSGFLTDADLELNKHEVVNDIMSRSEFGNVYNGLTNAQYVDTLIQTAAVTLPGGVRDAWVTDLNDVIKTRAQVFRELSERPEVSAKYLNEARVVSCYYGFFTRNPDGAYLNFLQRLDSGEINLGDLANAFINAAEYRQRFGP